MNALYQSYASKRLMVVLILSLSISFAREAFSQGTVIFQNLIYGLDAPIYDVDGVTPLAGDAFRVQLYGAPEGTSELRAVEPSVDFSLIGNGYFFGGNLRIPDVPAGQIALLEVRAWRSSDGETYEGAFHPGGHVGESNRLSLTLGGGVADVPLLGLESFSLYVVPIPEPATGILALVGLVVLAGGRKLVSRRHRRQ